MLAAESLQLQSEITQLRRQVEELQQAKVRLENLLSHDSFSGDTPFNVNVFEEAYYCEKLLEALPIGILIAKTNGTPYYANSLAQQLMGRKIDNYSHPDPPQPIDTAMSIAEWLGWPHLYLAGTTQIYPVERHPLIRALNGDRVYAHDLEIHHANQITLLEMWAAPVSQPPHTQYAVALFQDMTSRKRAETERLQLMQEEAQATLLKMQTQLQQEIRERELAEMALQKANQELEKLVIVDPLTQLPNQRRLNQYFQQEWRRLSRDKLPLSLIICSIDYLDSYTHHYGLPATEKCLKEVAQSIRRATKRPSDLVARYNKGFAAVLPNTNADGAVQVAAGMRWEVKMLKLLHEHSPINHYVTLSVGVSSVIPSSNSSPEELITAAEEALLEAQQKGRNRVECKEHLGSRIL